VLCGLYFFTAPAAVSAAAAICLALAFAPGHPGKSGPQRGVR
jgi:hypothetical protein